MTTATFLAVSDIRGDLDFLGKVLDLASRRTVGAQAVFIQGNFVGPIITPEERPEYLEARKILEKELNSRRDHYAQQGIRDITSLGHHMTANPANYRRQIENGALRTLRVIVGLKDKNGRLAERGRAALRARRIYEDAEGLFKKHTTPVYVLADTVLAEDVFLSFRALHFARMYLAGVPIRAVPGEDAEDPDALPEIHIGARRGGKPVNLDEYMLGEGRIIFSPQINPMLHEALMGNTGKLVITSGDGAIDLSYPDSVVSAQAREFAYLYSVDGDTAVRRPIRYVNGSFADPGADDIAEAKSKLKPGHAVDRRRELEERARLAGFGQELIRFIDLIRNDNPVLAREMESSKDRLEVVLKYVREMENQRQNLQDVLSAERAGMSRLINALAPVLGEHVPRIFAALNLPHDKQHNVTAIDAANVEVVRLVAEALGVKSAKADE